MALRSGLLRLLFILGLLGLWAAVVQAEWVSPLLLPAPAAVAKAALKLAVTPEVRTAFGSTVLAVALAFAISAVGGVAFGIWMGLSRWAYGVLYPVSVVFFSVPKMIFLPLILLFFGSGPDGKVAYGVLSGFFPAAITVTAGVLMVNERLLVAARSLGASGPQVVWHVIMPGTVPAMVTALWYALKNALMGVLLAELFVSQRGIGYFINFFTSGFQTDKTYALILALSLAAIGLGACWRLLEERVHRWHGTAR